MGGLPAWEGGHPGRHAGWKPALLKEERDALHSIVICSSLAGSIAKAKIFRQALMRPNDEFYTMGRGR